jgi:arylsulfatase A-like enzyme
MDSPSAESIGQRPSDDANGSPVMVVLLAISLGLCAGYLDVAIMLFKKLCWNPEGYFRAARDFAWTVPLGHVVLLATAGLVVAGVTVIWRDRVSLRRASWFLATLAIWGALLRMPMYSGASLLLAAGLGRLIGDLIAARGLDARLLRRATAALLAGLGVLAALTSGRQALLEYLALAKLPTTTTSVPNVVLIVWDTVRAYNTSLAGYPRNSTPNLALWARTGVKYERAIAPAPWTYPSHACFFTGQWPLRLNAQWKFTLDAPGPTLAEYLASRGYQTAGFAANTNCCTYESGLARGFAHYEDYALAPQSLLTRTVPGKWLLEQAIGQTDYHAKKWIGLQSRSARGINAAFLGWLGARRADRPFFAFLNYFDAHEPYMPPREFEGRFGIKPRTSREYDRLFHFVGVVKDPNQLRDIVMARDCYDDCIAYLDQELGRLLAELKRRGLLDNTVVIITSDHGEAFGEHGTIGHSYSVYLDEIFVPLVILAPGAPAGRSVNDPASLRDLPATVVDLLGLSNGSPFPGRSLAAGWSDASDRPPSAPASPALAEQADESVWRTQTKNGPAQPHFRMSLVAAAQHYIRDGIGTEKLFDLRNDPFEQFDLMKLSDHNREVRVFRKMLLEALTENKGSAEVERAYLEQYRQRLKNLVDAGTADTLAGAR